MYTHTRNWGARICDRYAYEGMRVLVMENELLRISILLDQGSDIFEFLYKPRDLDFMLRTPNGIRNRAKYIASQETPGAFLDYYEGGWQELFPHGSAPTHYKGADIGMHGEVWGLPWDCTIVEDTPEYVSARLSVRTVRMPFYLEKTLTLRSRSPVLFIHERAVNESDQSLDVMWGHHPALGPQFVSESCILDSAAKRGMVDGVEGPWPVAEGVDHRLYTPVEREVEMMKYLLDVEEGWYALTNPDLQMGFGMRWDPKVFPYVWIWQEFNYTPGYPWFRRVFASAVEPFSSLPRAHEEGTRLLSFKPGETIEIDLLATVYEGGPGVTGIDDQGRVQRAGDAG